MKKMLTWFSGHPWVGSAFFLGLMAGAVICLPFVPYSLPDSSATLIGSAAGAVFAVWGAAWVTEQKERREMQTARDNIGGFLLHIFERTAIADVALSEIENGNWTPRQLLPAARGFLNAIESARVKSPYLQPVFTKAGMEGIFAYTELVNALMRIGQLPDHIFDLANNGDPASQAANAVAAKTQLMSLREFRERVEKMMTIVNGIDFSAHVASHPRQELPRDDVARSD